MYNSKTKSRFSGLKFQMELKFKKTIFFLISHEGINLL